MTRRNAVNEAKLDSIACHQAMYVLKTMINGAWVWWVSTEPPTRHDYCVGVAVNGHYMPSYPMWTGKD